MDNSFEIWDVSYDYENKVVNILFYGEYDELKAIECAQRNYSNIIGEIIEKHNPTYSLYGNNPGLIIIK